MLVTVSAKMSLALRPPVSVAMTLTCTVPTLAFSGVPLNVRVVALKPSQLGDETTAPA